MTESLSDPHASQTFVIVTREQMDALNMLLFYLVKVAHEHHDPRGDPNICRDDAAEMHRLLAKWEGR